MIEQSKNCYPYSESQDFVSQGYCRWKLSLSSAEASVGYDLIRLVLRYISQHFTWRILEHERSRWAKKRRRKRESQPTKASAEEREKLSSGNSYTFIRLNQEHVYILNLIPVSDACYTVVSQLHLKYKERIAQHEQGIGRQILLNDTPL